jgi:hypothetical protein
MHRIGIESRSRSAELSGFIATPGTPDACVTPAVSITSSAAMAAFILAIEVSFPGGYILAYMLVLSSMERNRHPVHFAYSAIEWVLCAKPWCNEHLWTASRPLGFSSAWSTLAPSARPRWNSAAGVPVPPMMGFMRLHPKLQMDLSFEDRFVSKARRVRGNEHATDSQADQWFRSRRWD